MGPSKNSSTIPKGSSGYPQDVSKGIIERECSLTYSRYAGARAARPLEHRLYIGLRVLGQFCLVCHEGSLNLREVFFFVEEAVMLQP